MKKLILTTTFLALGAWSVLAQGTVNFGNLASNPWGDTVDRKIYADSALTTPLQGAQWRVVLLQDGNVLGGTASLIPVAALAGQFTGGTRTIPNGGIGTSVTLQVGIYDSATGATWQEATLKGTSAPFVYNQVLSDPPNTRDTLMLNLRAFAVPEPSTIALGVLGLGALLLFRRRK